MSGLIDTIVRRRRASASSRLGPPAHLRGAPPWVSADEPPPVNGQAPPAVNGHAAEPAVEEPVPAVVDSEPQLEPEAEPHLEPGGRAARRAGARAADHDVRGGRARARRARARPPEPAAPEPSHRSPSPSRSLSRRVDALEYPPLRERVALRRRARYLAGVREVQLRDLGGFLLELHRFGRSRPDLVQAKLAATAATDAELRSLHHRLDEEAPIGELRRPGIGGACEHCGAVHGSLDRFCASCGEPLR